MRIKLINFLTVIFLLIIPYYIFEGKMYLGGDDTRLFYSYPIEFLTNATFFSWYKLSALGIHGPSQYLAPFLLVASVADFLSPSKVILNYLAFSAPLILGFIYFQKAIIELFNFSKKNQTEIYLGSLFYVLSPILIINQMFVFLIAIWLIALIPIVVYYFLKYLKTSEFKYVYIASLWCLLLAFALYAVPWLLGFVLPILLAMVSTFFLFKKDEILFFLRKLLFFITFIFFSQAFWLLGFLSTYLSLGQDSFASKFLSKGFVDTFTPTVVSTAIGNVFYPLLNLFHRQIAFDFEWKLKDVFTTYYDISFSLNSFFIVLLVIGVLNYRSKLKNVNSRIFIILLVSLCFSIYFLTVNIGPLKDLFIIIGQIPGFTMFRNFYDKFAPGYVIIYASVITVCLTIVLSVFRRYRNFFLSVFLVVILINFVPVKQTVNSPLWTTDNIYKTVEIPNEYFEFMSTLSENISSSNNFFSFPFGSSAYSIIIDEKSPNHIYAGVSPVKILSGISDVSGHYAFNFTEIANTIDSYIINNEYEQLREVMYQHNINYVLVTRNVPLELGSSYLFNNDLFDVQNEEFLDAITSKKVLESSNGNYELYEAREVNSLISGGEVYFKKISQAKFKIYIRNINKEQELAFLDSYHNGWKLYLEKNPELLNCNKSVLNESTKTTECVAGQKLFELEDISFSFKRPIFESSQDLVNNYANKWSINPDYIKKNFEKTYYRQNGDGSIDIELTLYFLPQNNFYFGTVISMIVFAAGLLYLIFHKYEKNKKRN